MKFVARMFPVALIVFSVLSPAAEAQVYSSAALGVAKPTGDFGDLYDLGLTYRGQVGISLLFADVHLQTGWTDLAPVEDYAEGKDLNIYHAGAGARVGLGFLWVGANAAYFFGDGEKGLGLFPEVGLKVWRLEGVVDYRIDGDENWGAARVGFRF